MRPAPARKDRARALRRPPVPAGELRRLYEEERWTLQELARAFGCSLRTVRRWLDEAGVQVRARGSLGASTLRGGRAVSWAATQALLDAGASQSAAAAARGVSKQAVSAAVARGRLRRPA